MTALSQSVRGHLDRIGAIGCRPVGTPGNHAMAQYLTTTFEAAGLTVEQQPFPCFTWSSQGADLRLGGEALPALVNPFSLSREAHGVPVAVATLRDLEQATLTGRIALLYGDLTREALAPKGFRFWNPERHQEIIRLLEAAQPEAVIAVSPRLTDPLPLTEDWAFALPIVTVDAATGLRLLRSNGQRLSLTIRSQRAPGQGLNIIARRAGSGPQKLIFCAHFDTKYGTPGALDNGAGTAALLRLAELLAGADRSLGLEFVAFGSEEYGGTGEMLYQDQTLPEFPSVLAAVNFDGVGLVTSVDSVACLACSDALTAAVQDLLGRYPTIVEAEPWVESDHSLFWPHGVPSLALTSVAGTGLNHRPEESMEWAEPERIEQVARFVRDLVLGLE